MHKIAHQLSKSNSLDGSSEHRSRLSSVSREIAISNSDDSNISVDDIAILDDAEQPTPTPRSDGSNLARPNVGDTLSTSALKSFVIRRALRRDRRSNSTSVESAVFAQAFWYVMAFLLTWIVFLAVQLRPDLLDDPSSYPRKTMALARKTPAKDEEKCTTKATREQWIGA